VKDYREWEGPSVWAVTEQIKDDAPRIIDCAEDDTGVELIYVSADYERSEDRVNYSIGTYNEDGRNVRFTSEALLQPNGLSTEDIVDLLGGTMQDNLDMPAVMIEGQIIRDERPTKAFPEEEYPDTGEYRSEYV